MKKSFVAMLLAAVLAAAVLAGCGGGTSASPRPVIYTDPANGFQLHYTVPPFQRVGLDDPSVRQLGKVADAPGLRVRLALLLPDSATFAYASGPRKLGGIAMSRIEDNLSLFQRVLSNSIGAGTAPPSMESVTIARVGGFDALTLQMHRGSGANGYSMRFSIVFGPTGTFTIMVGAPTSSWEADLRVLQPLIDSFDTGARGSG